MNRRKPTLALLCLSMACSAVYRPPIGGETRGPRGTVTPILDEYAQARLILLEAINADRVAHGVRPVALDSLATVVAQFHAEAMARGGYLSHYEEDGSLPYERFAQAGGLAHVRENVFRSELRPSGTSRPGPLLPGFDIRQAEEWLMGSPGHRRTILDPFRTHVGLGVAEDSLRGAIYVVQEFVANYVNLVAPTRGWRGAPAVITGRMVSDDLRPLLLQLTRESPPGWTRSPDSVPPRGAYVDGSGPGVTVPPWRIRWNPSDHTFRIELLLPRSSEPSRYYGILYVASEDDVREALGSRKALSSQGWPGAAFMIEFL